MAEWIVAGEPQMDLWHMDVRRFGPHYRSPSYTLKRTKEVYETYYDIHYPGEERQAGRPLRVSSRYAWHAEHGAAFGEKSGWERVNWYASNAARRATRRCARAAGPASTGRRRSAPSTAPAASAPALFDESSFAKFEVSGRARRSSSSRCATTTSRATSGASPTRRCSTRAAGSSATSR